MGFTTGFTGGVTLTLSIAYLSVQAHQRNRRLQCETLRANTSVLQALALADPVAAARLAMPNAAAADGAAAIETPADLSAAAAAEEIYYPSRAPPPPTPRTAFVDDLKSRWNAEVEGAVRRVQTTDWDEVRDGAETTLVRLWRRAFGGATGDAAGAAIDTLAAEAKSALQSGAAAAKSAADAVVGTPSTPSKTAAASTPSAAKATAPDPSKSEVERALEQRYKHTDDGRMQKSVSELLAERYAQKAT